MNLKDRYPLNILIFPGGTEIGLEIQRSLRYCKEIRLFSAASNVSNHAPYAFNNHFKIASISDPTWVDDINRIIEQHSIDAIYPANDLIIDAICEQRDNLVAPTIMPSNEVVRLIRSKSNTYKKFCHLIPTPKEYKAPQIDDFPLFLKPDDGYGAQKTFFCPSIDSYNEYINQYPELLAFENLPGDEYTVDCFSNQQGELLFCQARKRERIRMGTTMDGSLADDNVMNICQDYASRISSLINITGAWFFQIKRAADNSFKLLEIEPRIAGTMSLNRVRGVNFPLLSILNFFNLDVGILYNHGPQTIDRRLASSYKMELDYSTVYVDLDDTLVIHGKINTQLIQFLYQAINTGKRIILISKNLESDKDAVLRRYRFSHLFDEIHWLTESESKSDYMSCTDAIFIDDSYSQRSEVAKNVGIPTFDPSMVECLIDERH